MSPNEQPRHLAAVLARLHSRQGQLAQAVGLSDSALSRYLNGTRRPSHETAERIADALGLAYGDAWVIDPRDGRPALLMDDAK